MDPKFRKFPLCITALVALLLAGTAWGQTSGSVTGTVLDPQGAAVPGATVKAIDTKTNLAVDTITSGEGTFSFPTLQPSNYTIEVELTGFKKLVKTGVVVETASKTNIGNLALEVGGITETVTVSADAAQLQLKSTSGEIGATVTGRQIMELALNGRNLLDMMKLIPGVRSAFDGAVAGPGGYGNFNINGTRGTMHTLSIDGATNVDTGSNGTQHVMLNMDAVAEFSVFISNYQAEFGRSAGGDIRILTRSGERKYHGTGYLFHRHEGLNANSFSNNANGLKADGTPLNPRNLYRYNYFGYNVGGPIPIGGPFKGKLFFFGGQEFHRQLDEHSVLAQHEQSQQHRSSLFQCAPGQLQLSV
jgi:hypothetical protein